ncbi:multiple epidermal growth factor-like domains protein 10 [Equus quagga]|uniref:multiple epidermal growth factor-like domains protein 10 n=1 Tax=Equus quagga TaxID=89248 RepID=UPI001EE33110|nr:multiple epidermal growth factor-like domains protein 10 [Equus quagga]
MGIFCLQSSFALTQLSQACLPGFYGLNCAHICDCKNGASCDAASGQCICPAGFHGSQCEKECRSGQYGPNSAVKCQCVHRAPCSPCNGSCTCPSKRMGPTCEENGLDDPQ